MPKVYSKLVKLVPFPVPDFDTAPVLEIVGRLSWRKARPKTRWGHPQVPHSYVVRGRPPGNDADYEELFHLIQQHGRVERFGGRRNKYLYPGDGQKYWVLSDITASTIINRMKIADDIARMRAEGQID